MKGPRFALISLLLLAVLWVPLQAAVAFTALMADASTSNLHTYTTTIADGFAADTTFSCASGSVCYCAALTTDSTVGDHVISLSQTGQGWAGLFGAVPYDPVATPGAELNVFRAVGSGAAAAGLTLSVAGGADTQTSAHLVCVEVSGSDTGGSEPSATNTADAGTSITVTLSALTANSGVLAFCANGAGTGATTIEVEAGYTGGTETGVGSPNGSLRALWHDAGSADATPTCTRGGSGTPNWGAAALETKIAAAGGATLKQLLLLGVGHP